MKLKSLTIVFLLVLLLIIVAYTIFELLIKGMVWLALLLVVALSGGLLLLLINPFDRDLFKALRA